MLNLDIGEKEREFLRENCKEIIKRLGLKAQPEKIEELDKRKQEQRQRERKYDRQYNHVYYAGHREKAKEYAREYRKKNPEKVKEAQKRWRENNRGYHFDGIKNIMRNMRKNTVNIVVIIIWSMRNITESTH